MVVFCYLVVMVHGIIVTVDFWIFALNFFWIF